MRGRLTTFVAIAFLGLFLVPPALEAAPAVRGAYFAPSSLAPAQAPALALAEENVPGAIVGRANVQLVGTANEPMILADRAGQYLWIGALTQLWRSGDQGSSWGQLSPPTIPGAFTDGYALAQDSAGGFYLSNTQGQDIWVVHSPDGGASWDSTTASRWLTEAEVIADRAWLATNGPNNVAVVMNGATQGETCSYSTDAGATFTQRAAAKLDQGTPNAGNIVFDHAGHVTYAIDAGVQSWRGTTPCSTTSVAAGAPSQLALPADGSQIFTQVALDSSDRPYVAQPTPGNGAMELRAFDGWGGAYRSLVVSPAAVKSSTFGAIAARSTGEIAVAWYGSTAAGDPASSIPANAVFNLYVARIKNFWTTPTIQVDQVTTTGMHQGIMCMSGVTCTAGRNLGDYMGVTYDNAGNLHVAYVHDLSGTGRVYYAKLAAI